MRDRVLVAAVGGWVVGIGGAPYLALLWQVAAGAGVLATAFLCLAWVRRSEIFLIAAVCLIAVLLGGWRVAVMPQALPVVFTPLLGTTVSFTGTVIAEPDIRETTQRLQVAVSHEGHKTTLLAVAPLHPVVRYGEPVHITGKLTLPDPFITDTGRTFRYDQFLAKDGIFAVVQRASLASRGTPQSIGAVVMNHILSLKYAFQRGIAAALPEPMAALASGLITGGKQGLGPALLDAFIVAGLVHIVVLSGYNVMIVAEAVLRACGFLPRQGAAIVAGICIGLFVFAAGAGAASIRAGLMAGLALLARATGRTYAVVRALLIAGVAMTIANPLVLLHDPGFQLSFIATLGLILGASLVATCFVWVRSTFWRELIAATIAAQIAVLPLLLYQTGLLSLISLPVNLAILPVVPLAMGLSAVAAVVGMLMPIAAPVIGIPAFLLLSYIIRTAEWSASIPLAAVAVPEFSLWVVGSVYLLMAYCIRKVPQVQSTCGTSSSRLTHTT